MSRGALQSKGKAGTKNEPKWYFVQVQKRGLKVDPHVSNLKSVDFFFDGFRSTLIKGGDTGVR